jgi:hypothetical protein
VWLKLRGNTSWAVDGKLHPVLDKTLNCFRLIFFTADWLLTFLNCVLKNSIVVCLAGQFSCVKKRKIEKSIKNFENNEESVLTA